MKIGFRSLFLFLMIFLSFHVLNLTSALGFSSFGDLSCGQVNQPACSILSNEFWKTGACDKGLKQLGGKCFIGSRAQLEITKDNWFLRAFNFITKKIILQFYSYSQLKLKDGHWIDT